MTRSLLVGRFFDTTTGDNLRLTYMRPARAIRPEFRRKGFVISTLLYLVIMVIAAALFVSFGYKLIFKEESNPGFSTQLPPEVQEQKADTVDQTANWETFTNAYYQFSFKYPDKIFTLTDQDTDTVKVIDLQEKKYLNTKNDNNYIPRIGLLISPDKGLSLNDWFNKYVGDGGTNKVYMNVAGKSTRTVASEQAIEFIGASGEGELRVVYVHHKSNIFEFSATTNTKNEDLTQTLYQILSTFRFE